MQYRPKSQTFANILDSLSGASSLLAPRLMVAFGSNRKRYETVTDMQKYAGIEPIVERSGKNHGLTGVTVAPFIISIEITKFLLIC